MEEIKVNENVLNEVEEVAFDQNESGSNIGKIVFGLGVLAVAGIGTLVYKNREKIDQMRIAKLEKKGYVISKAEEVVDEDSSDDEEIELEKE